MGNLYKRLEYIWFDLESIVDNKADNPFNLKVKKDLPLGQKCMCGKLVHGCKELNFAIRNICDNCCIVLTIETVPYDFELIVSEINEINLYPKNLKEHINSDFIIGIIESFETQIKKNYDNLTKAINNYELCLNHNKEVVEVLAKL